MMEQACHGTPVSVRDLFKELGEIEINMLKSGELDKEYLSILVLDLVEASKNMKLDSALMIKAPNNFRNNEYNNE